MTPVAFEFSPTLPDGSPPPDGAGRHVLAVFDFMRPGLCKPHGRSRLRSTLMTQAGGPVSEPELEEVIVELKQRGLLVDAPHPGPTIKAPTLPDLPGMPKIADIYSPGDPQPGEQCYSTTQLGAKAAHLCRTLLGRALPVWQLGAQRVHDQALACCQPHWYTELATIDAVCCCVAATAVSHGIEKNLTWGLLSLEGTNYRLTPDGEGRLQQVMRELNATPSMPGQQGIGLKPTRGYEPFRDWLISDGHLGRGGQGDVVPVWHPSRHLKGALKRPAGRRGRTEKGKERFVREIDALRAARHPFVAKVLDFGTEPEPFLVTEYAEFGSLEDCRDPFRGDAWRSLRLVRDVAVGLREAHKLAITHRDIKPGNILLMSLDHPLVADFGIAYFEDRDPLTSTGEHVGSFLFAPREYETEDHPKPSFDVFSLGCVLHWALTGEDATNRPYRGRRTLKSIEETLGERRGRLLDVMLAKMVVEDPAARYQSMEEVIGAVDQVLDELFAGASPTPGGCHNCKGGKYLSAGPLRLGSGTEIIAYPANTHDGVGLNELGPELLLCDNCGDSRVILRHTRRLKPK